MKSHTFTRGVGLSGALMLSHAAVAFGATSHAQSSHTATTDAVARTHAAASHGHVESAKALAASTGENTPLHLAGTTAAKHVASSGSSASIVRTIVGLAIVIAVIYGVAWIMKLAKKGKTRVTGSGLSQLAHLPLGSGRSVTVVRAGNEIIVVGVAENGVTPLRTYTEAEAIANGIQVPPAEAPPSYDQAEQSFGGVMGILRRMTVRS
jgi:flagellar protein FliO/FliZ